MLYVFYGTDQIEVRTQAHLILAKLLKEGEEVERIESDGYSAGKLQALSSTVSLFSPCTVYLVETPSSEEAFLEDFMASLKELGESEHQFVVIEQTLNAAQKKKITTYATIVDEYKKTEETAFNPFKMSDALALRDKRSLWLLFQEAKSHNLSSEEIIGTFWWQLKTMRLAAVTGSAEEAGMKDYPYKKAKSALTTFALPEVEKKSRELLTIYHDGHRGKRDLDLALEAWVLGL
jgi:hypothetical protein